MLHQLARPALIILFIISIGWIIFRVLKKRNRSPGYELLLFFFVIYIAVVLLITLYPLPLTREKVVGAKGVNFIPFENTMKEFSDTFKRERSFMSGHTIENIVGNIFLFLPFGIFLPLISKKFRSFGKVFLFGLLFSLSIETLQLVSRQFGVYRAADIDDVILNVFGTVCGFLFLKLFYTNTGSVQNGMGWISWLYLRNNNLKCEY